MRKFIIGHTGFVGKELVKQGFIPLVCDVTNLADVDQKIKKERPDLLFLLASKSDVDFCQKIENEKLVKDVNVWGTNNVFETLNKYRLPGVFISSDQIWHGGLFEKHSEDSKLTTPVNFYGLTKLIAEQYVNMAGGNIIRTSYLFNSERLTKNIQLIKAGLKQDYPTFIQRSFMHVKDFCNSLSYYADSFYKMPNILHIAGSQRVSWYKFMKEVQEQYGFSGTIKPRYFEKSGFAPRPWFGGLDVNDSIELGFSKVSYIEGVHRMRYES